MIIKVATEEMSKEQVADFEKGYRHALFSNLLGLSRANSHIIYNKSGYFDINPQTKTYVKNLIIKKDTCFRNFEYDDIFKISISLMSHSKLVSDVMKNFILYKDNIFQLENVDPLFMYTSDCKINVRSEWDEGEISHFSHFNIKIKYIFPERLLNHSLINPVNINRTEINHNIRINYFLEMMRLRDFKLERIQ